jgi:hypothetical protein
MNRCWFLFAVVLAGSSRAAETPARPTLEVALRESEDRATVQWEKSRAVVDVRSKSGIGGATIRRAKGTWPAVMLRLHLKGLEKLDVSNGKLEVSASVLSHSGNRILQSVRRGAEKKRREVRKGDAEHLAIAIVDRKPPARGKIPVGDGHIDIALPKALLADGVDTLEVNWIDFYR